MTSMTIRRNVDYEMIHDSERAYSTRFGTLTTILRNVDDDRVHDLERAYQRSSKSSADGDDDRTI